MIPCRVCKTPIERGPVLPDMCEACTNKATRLMSDSTRPSHRLGDKVATAAKALGFKQKPGCGCADRQFALNRLNLNASVGEVARGLLEAIINPPPKEE